jgi:hypothetical protein
MRGLSFLFAPHPLVHHHSVALVKPGYHFITLPEFQGRPVAGSISDEYAWRLDLQRSLWASMLHCRVDHSRLNS